MYDNFIFYFACTQKEDELQKLQKLYELRLQQKDAEIESLRKRLDDVQVTNRKLMIAIVIDSCMKINAEFSG